MDLTVTAVKLNWAWPLGPEHARGFRRAPLRPAGPGRHLALAGPAGVESPTKQPPGIRVYVAAAWP